jgi:hypothetical protein
MRYGRSSTVKDGNVIVPLWLIFDATGTVRMTRGEPDVSRSERAMQLTVTVPLSLFKTPTIAATLTIDAPVAAIPQIDVTAAAEALRGVIGCDIDVRVASVDRSAERHDPQGHGPQDESAVPDRADAPKGAA